MIIKNNFSPLESLVHPLFAKHSVQVQIKRDDLLHPIISGNKSRKLKFNLKHIQQQGYQGAISFGGSYSNHIHAFAFACYQHNIPCIGVIRGEAHYANNYTLSWAQHWGMKCHFVDRKTYKRRFDDDFLAELAHQYPNHFIVPEGGSNPLAIDGVSEVIDELNQQTSFDTLMTPLGSGGTLAGLVSGDEKYARMNNQAQHNILGIAVLKRAEYLIEEVKKLMPKTGNNHHFWKVMTEFHCGGYGKFSAKDVARLIDFNQQVAPTFEPVYSGKMLLALLDLLEQGYFNVNERIVLLHTGGLQGLGGMFEQKRLTPSDWPPLPLPT
mgnify:CR=1 FL=1